MISQALGVERGPDAEHLHRQSRAVLDEVADQVGSDPGRGKGLQRVELADRGPGKESSQERNGGEGKEII